MELFSRIICQSYLNGFEQIYEAFVSFVRLYSYNYEQQTKNLFESISSIVLIDVNYKNISRFSDFLDAFSSIFELEDGKQKEGIKQILLSAINSGLQEDLSDFEKRAILKAYNSIGLPDKAVEYFEKKYAKKKSLIQKKIFILCIIMQKHCICRIDIKIRLNFVK